jgi:outer membrane murein-binding lipoprotein Lpp
VADYDDMLRRSNEGLRDILKNLEPTSENEMKRRRSKGFVRFLVAICIGVAATLAWQSYGDATKQIIATRAPELGWSPAARQMIASWVQQFVWTKPPPEPESTAVQSSLKSPQTASVAQTAPAAVTPSAAIAPAINSEQVHQIAADLGSLQRTVEQIAGGQDQMRREIDRLQGAVAEILVKLPEPPPSPLTAPAHKPKPVAAPSPRAPAPAQLPPHP